MSEKSQYRDSRQPGLEVVEVSPNYYNTWPGLSPGPGPDSGYGSLPHCIPNGYDQNNFRAPSDYDPASGGLQVAADRGEGLQVAADKGEGLQVAADRGEGLYVAADRGEGLMVVEDTLYKLPSHASPVYNPYYYPSPSISSILTPPSGLLSPQALLRPAPTTRPTAGEVKKARRKRQMLWGIAIVAGVLITVGAVLGGVLGSRVTAGRRSSNSVGGGGAGNGTSSGGSPTNGTTNANVTVPTDQVGGAIMANSKLAVAGWFDGPNFEIRLTYQGSDNKVRMSTFRSTNTNWSEPIVMDLIKARPGTPLAMSAYIGTTPRYLRTFYADERSTLRGLGFYADSQRPAAGNVDPIGDYLADVHPSSRMTSYWPYVLMQDSHSALRIFAAKSFGENSDSGSKAYTQDIIDIPFTPGLGLGSGIVALPTAKIYQDAGGILFADASGALSEYVHSNGGKTKATWSWKQGSTNVFIPSNTTTTNPQIGGPAVGGFVVAQSSTDSTDDLVSTYALFQDATSPTGDVLFAYQDGASSAAWKGPVAGIAALAGADRGTDIACVTAQAWNLAKVLVSSSRAISRCYFQAGGGRVREVEFDGSNWKVVGYVPIH